VSLLRSDKDFEPLEPTRTAWSALVYGAVALLLGLLAFALLSSSAYREGGDVTLQAAQERSRAVLPVIAALIGSSFAHGVAARLSWTAHSLTVPYALALSGVTLSAVWWLPSSLRGYAFGVLTAQVLALGLYSWLRRLPKTETIPARSR
jgi:hypothetical protein